MNKAILILFLYTFRVFAGIDEFPEERKYTSKDKGYSQYSSRSMQGTNKLVLTFDDGPSEITTPKILDTLAKYNVKATFFMLGQNITAKTLPIVIRMLREGHTIGAHSWAHVNSNTQTQAQFEKSTKKTLFTLDAVMKEAGIYQNEVYFRFPYGAYGTNVKYHHLNVLRDLSYQIYGSNCINFAFWGIDTEDWIPNNDAEGILQNIKANMVGGMAYEHKAIRDAKGKITYIRSPYLIKNPVKGGVVLMHDIHARTVEALPLILDYALQNKIDVVPLSSVSEYEFGTRVCGNQIAQSK